MDIRFGKGRMGEKVMPFFQHPVIRVIIGGGDSLSLPTAPIIIQAGQAVLGTGGAGKGGTGESGKGLAQRRVHRLESISRITGRGGSVGVEVS